MWKVSLLLSIMILLIILRIMCTGSIAIGNPNFLYFCTRVKSSNCIIFFLRFETLVQTRYGLKYWLLIIFWILELGELVELVWREKVSHSSRDLEKIFGKPWELSRLCRDQDSLFLPRSSRWSMVIWQDRPGLQRRFWGRGGLEPVSIINYTRSGSSNKWFNPKLAGYISIVVLFTQEMKYHIFKESSLQLWNRLLTEREGWLRMNSLLRFWWWLRNPVLPSFWPSIFPVAEWELEGVKVEQIKFLNLLNILVQHNRNANWWSQALWDIFMD